MEQHPVPQDVTGFQFKLIGDITLKQFGYLAGGFILAYLITKLPLIPGFLRWPFAGIFAFLGIGLAFLPIEERPLDMWLMAFIKRIYSPTQYVWQKNNPAPDILTQIGPQVAPVPPPSPPLPVEVKKIPPVPAPHVAPSAKPPPTRPQPLMQSVPVASPPPPPPQPKARPASDSWSIGAPPVKYRTATTQVKFQAPTQVTGKRVVFEKPAAVQPKPLPSDDKAFERLKTDYQQATQKLNTQISSLQKELQQGTIAKERFLELQQVLTQLASEKDLLHNELIDLKRRLITQTPTITEKPSVYTTVPTSSKATVKIVPPASAIRVGIPRLTSQPNVITGIIKDNQGILLPNLIITVKDKEDVPVRALKSNKLGQFAASTPLSNGTYIIEVEDPKKAYQFNRIEVTLTGAVLPPLEVSAVSQRDIMRQKLSNELFGNNPI